MTSAVFPRSSQAHRHERCWVIERCENFGLALETREPVGIGDELERQAP